jgi:hypothetical protein
MLRELILVALLLSVQDPPALMSLPGPPSVAPRWSEANAAPFFAPGLESLSRTSVLIQRLRERFVANVSFRACFPAENWTNVPGKNT